MATYSAPPPLMRPHELPTTAGGPGALPAGYPTASEIDMDTSLPPFAGGGGASRSRFQGGQGLPSHLQMAPGPPRSSSAYVGPTGSSSSGSGSGSGGGGGVAAVDQRRYVSESYSSSDLGAQYAQQARAAAARNSPPAPSSPVPLLDNSHLRPGASAALLSHDKTLELYRANAKKTNDPELIFEFAVFMIDAAKSLDLTIQAAKANPRADAGGAAGHATAPASAVNEQKRDDLVREAIALLKRLADRGHPDAQYFLADCYANGIGTVRARQDFDRAFPLFVLAAKHGHPDASYRAGTCCEHGWGCRRESAKAVQFYKKAAAALHPGAMYRLGTAELNGSLGLASRPKEGVKWLKRSAEHATTEFPHALHELALLHERGIENVLFVDLEYACELLAQAAELGYAPSAFKLGECYEYGKMGCPMDPALSIHYYNIAAQQGHRDGCFALTAWYLVGSPGVLPQSDTEAYLWALKAAEAGLAKAQYAVGYFTETGIGTAANQAEALKWFKLAAEAGDKRAEKRLKGVPVSQIDASGMATQDRKDMLGGGSSGKDGCVVM